MSNLIDQMNEAIANGKKSGEPVCFFIDGWEVSHDDMRHYLATGDKPIWLRKDGEGSLADMVKQLPPDHGIKTIVDDLNQDAEQAKFFDLDDLDTRR